MNECRSTLCFHVIFALSAALQHCFKESILAVRPHARAITRRRCEPTREIVCDRHDAAGGGLGLVRGDFDEAGRRSMSDQSAEGSPRYRNPAKAPSAIAGATLRRSFSSNAPSCEGVKISTGKRFSLRFSTLRADLFLSTASHVFAKPKNVASVRWKLLWLHGESPKAGRTPKHHPARSHSRRNEMRLQTTEPITQISKVNFMTPFALLLDHFLGRLCNRDAFYIGP